MTYKLSFEPNKDGQVSISNNGHYAIYVRDREEMEFPNEKITRYEIVNLGTLAVEGRVANLQMAYLVMNEFDRRLEELMTQGVDEDEVQGVPMEMNLGQESTH